MNLKISCDQPGCDGIIRELPGVLVSMALDGESDTCPECDAYGTFQIDADEGSVRVVFISEERDGSPFCRCETCSPGNVTCNPGKDD